MLTLRGRIHTLEDSYSPLLNLRCLQLQGDHPNKWSGDVARRIHRHTSRKDFQRK